MRILIAEDDPVSTLVLRSTLERIGHEVLAVRDGVEAWEYVERDAAQVLISDWMMPRMDGLTLCRNIRKRLDSPYVYVILLTARQQRADRLEGLRAGADDFLGKPLDRSELIARLQVAERILKMQIELRQRTEELERMHDALSSQNALLAEIAVSDPLTGLKNCRFFREQLDAWLALSARQGTPLSLAMIDVDHFKSYNDSFGHPAGDEVLCTVARILRGSLREPDLAARYGGEEFVVLMPGTDEVGGMAAGERLREEFSHQKWQKRPVSASIGVATWRPEFKTGAQLIDAADKALYRSKALGRDRVTHHDELTTHALAGMM